MFFFIKNLVVLSKKGGVWTDRPISYRFLVALVSPVVFFWTFLFQGLIGFERERVLDR